MSIWLRKLLVFAVVTLGAAIIFGIAQGWSWSNLAISPVVGLVYALSALGGRP